MSAARDRGDLYEDANLARIKTRETRAEADMWFLLACIARFAVPVPAGQEPSAYDGATRPSPRVLGLRHAIRRCLPVSALVPRQRCAPDAEVLRRNNRTGR